MLFRPFFLQAVLLYLKGAQADSCENAPVPVSYPRGGPVEDSQDLNSSSLIGRSATANNLQPRFKYYLEVSVMHTDGGNTGSTDDPGPLGIDPSISSSTSGIKLMIWGSDGILTGGYVNTSAGNPPPRSLVAVDVSSFDILAAWHAPNNETLGIPYTEYVQETNDILVSTKEGSVFVVHRDSCNGVPYFVTTRTIALADVIRTGEQLLNAVFDTAGNIWFTTGAIDGTGDAKQNSTTYGYITPDGKIAQNHVENEVVENGLAVSDMNIYMLTGPAGAADTPHAIGYMYSLTTDGQGGITIRWRVPYDSGSGKPNLVTSRGGGSTPALLADEYVAITDKADPQIHVNVYHQSPQASAGQQLVCQVPLFKSGESNNDNAIITHSDGERHGLVIQNDFGEIPIFTGAPGTDTDVNGEWNDMNKLAAGLTRVDVDVHGNCSVRWSNNLAIKAVSILSTKTGLLYSYIQDTERASNGEYIWYVAGIDWDTGETVYQIRTGAGGTFNDNWAQGTLGPDGTFYQSILGGVVAVKDT